MLSAAPAMALAWAHSPLKACCCAAFAALPRTIAAQLARPEGSVQLPKAAAAPGIFPALAAVIQAGQPPPVGAGGFGGSAGRDGSDGRVGSEGCAGSDGAVGVSL